MNNDLAQVQHTLVALTDEHIDETVSIDNSEAIDFYIGKLVEMESNVADKIINGGEVPEYKLEEALQTVHDLIFSKMVVLTLAKYKGANK